MSATPPPPNPLDAILPPRLAELVPLSYRFAVADPSPAKHRAPLRELAKHFGVSRERARQLRARALSLLSAPGAARLLSPLRAAACAFLDARGSTLSPDALSAHPSPFPPALPALPFFLLLSDIAPGAPPFFFRGFFSTLSPDVLALAAEAFSSLLDALRLSPVPLRSLEALAKRLPELPLLPLSARRPLLLALASSSPGALLTRDQRCGPADRALPALLRALLSRHPSSTLPNLVERFNALVHPHCQVGSGRIRAALLADPAVGRPSVGHYALIAKPSAPRTP